MFRGSYKAVAALSFEREMPLGMTEFDRAAFALVQSDFDAIEHDGVRAEWTDEGTHVTVTDLETGDTETYVADDLIRAASDRDVENARTGAEATE